MSYPIPRHARRPSVEPLECRRLFTGTYPLSTVADMSSDPQATAKLYLDFTGAAPQQWMGHAVPATPAYDLDGDPTTFTAVEVAAVRQIWAGIAEAFSPFNLDVTTIDPSPTAHAYAKGQVAVVVIGGDGSWYGQGEGGISYTDGFQTRAATLSNVAFVFPAELGFGSLSIAETATHESGHLFGLTHQSTYVGTVLVSEYNVGTPLAGPIMGFPDFDARALWWYGQDDFSAWSYQDDMAVLAGPNNGFGYRPPAVGQTFATATPLAVAGTAASAAGVVVQQTDGGGNVVASTTDTYSFTTGGGTVTFAVAVAAFDPTLHARAQLYDSAGNLVADGDDPLTLGQTVSATVPAGTYSLVVGSFGGYGDVGQYTVTGTVPVAPPPPPPWWLQSGADSTFAQTPTGQLTTTITALATGPSLALADSTGLLAEPLTDG